MIRTIFLLTAAAASLAAQDNKVTIPLSTPGQPATIKARLLSGSVTIVAGTGPEVTVEEHGAPIRRQATPPQGMHRIDVGGGPDIEEDKNTITLRGGIDHTDLTITVPANTSVELKVTNGKQVEISGLSGDVDVENTNGSITLNNVSGAVAAHTLNGEITASIDRITTDKPMSFTSLNGRVDVTLPSDTKARLRLKTNRGEVYSDFDVKLEPDASKPVIEDSRGQGGKFRIRMERGVYGTINGGGPEYLFQTMNGDILIHKK
jgi:DUF4097 and DUF4098 domain-containing protein YvlB